jgi:hypothetical protein
LPGADFLEALAAGNTGGNTARRERPNAGVAGEARIGLKPSSTETSRNRVATYRLRADLLQADCNARLDRLGSESRGGRCRLLRLFEHELADQAEYGFWFLSSAQHLHPIGRKHLAASIRGGLNGGSAGSSRQEWLNQLSEVVVEQRRCHQSRDAAIKDPDFSLVTG